MIMIISGDKYIREILDAILYALTGTQLNFTTQVIFFIFFVKFMASAGGAEPYGPFAILSLGLFGIGVGLVESVISLPP